ncbi:MAG TPA: phosphoenolpyruvate--protein phosphotransferase [Candidatus Aerophobetes bacterium]|uniref:Phosphoenolpyruvate-protein phosphotransferase n=1 Tax=Aerophobetes bacterium TaxID=2030807 RepID=A0A7V5HZ66_UNCAE|nr:phosphoenolpyruvate--protein phosphotransferase [Candidatus Aerophobetes bacterium]
MVLKGVPASPGIAIGKVYILEKEDFCILEYRIKKEEVDKEIKRFKEAVEESKKQILRIKERIREKIGEKEASIFQSHLNILEDPLLIDETIKRIKKEKVNAETALREVYKDFLERFKSIQTEFIEERFRDIEDVAQRILHNLLKRPMMSLSHLEESIIVVARNLSPSDTASMDKEKVLGFATDIGGRTSHAAIMARALEIPAVVGLRNVTEKVRPGSTIIVDGDRGRVIVNPTFSQIKNYQRKRKEFLAYREKLEELKSLPAQTIDGREIELAANIAGPEEVDVAIRNGAEGVGLYRTEYLYMNRSSLPSEEEQFEAYRKVAEKVAPNSVIIRTLDIGGDKFLSPLPVPREINPFMGWRGIRLSLELVGIFKTQLRAILRAAQYGKVKIMFPLVSSLEEVKKANRILQEVKKELEKEGVSFCDSIEVGIMVEVPSAAIIADVLAKEVDFFSLGTNDLIQYTLAIDRINEKVAHLYQPLHPTILRLIDNVVKAAHRENIWVGACGEMASDPLGMPVLLGLGVDELSVAPTSILEVKKVIRNISWEETQKIARHLLKLSTSQQTKRYVEVKIGRRIRKILKGE